MPPHYLRNSVLEQLHDAPTVGHLGVSRTYDRVRRRCFCLACTVLWFITSRHVTTANDESAPWYCLLATYTPSTYPWSHSSVLDLTCSALFLRPPRVINGLLSPRIIANALPSFEHCQRVAPPTSLTFSCTTSFYIMAPLDSCLPIEEGTSFHVLSTTFSVPAPLSTSVPQPIISRRMD